MTLFGLLLVENNAATSASPALQSNDEDETQVPDESNTVLIAIVVAAAVVVLGVGVAVICWVRKSSRAEAALYSTQSASVTPLGETEMTTYDAMPAAEDIVGNSSAASFGSAYSGPPRIEGEGGAVEGNYAAVFSASENNGDHYASIDEIK